MWLPTSSSGLGWSPSSPSASTSEARRTSARRSEEYTSELQSRLHLVCRLLLEKKKQFFRRQKYPNVVDATRSLLFATGSAVAASNSFWFRLGPYSGLSLTARSFQV